jgi:hypothetical protein
MEISNSHRVMNEYCFQFLQAPTAANPTQRVIIPSIGLKLCHAISLMTARKEPEVNILLVNV